MEEDRESTRYWCHQCNLEVDPILEIESVNCSLCHGGFVEQMDVDGSTAHETGGPDPDRAVSLWAPILLGMNNNNHPQRRRRLRHLEFDSGDNTGGEEDDNIFRRHYNSRRADDLELAAVMRRRRQSSASILQLLQAGRAGRVSESESETENNDTDTGNRDREHVVLINPFNRTIIVQGRNGNQSESHPIDSLGDYFTGPGFELVLQQSAENDPIRYGTPPAKKEAVEAMASVTIEDGLDQCWVCLDDFEVGIEAKEMPCKHRFHDKCILPWLELHSSCPVCRFELPSDDESKVDREGSRGGVGNGEEGRNGRRFSVSLPWPFTGLFSSGSGSGTHDGRDREDGN